MNFLRKIKVEYLLVGLFILMPFIEIYRCLFQDTISILSFALEELVVMGYVGILFLYTVYTIIKSHNWKSFLFYSFYFILVIVYIVLHYLNLTKFNTSVYPDVTYSFITESYYIIRAYIIPIVMGIVIYQLGLSDKTFSKTITYVSLTISSLIIVTNILGISFVSYSLENTTIAGNIFTWFSLPANADFDMYTSKAFFYSANQISALMFSITPIIVKNVIKKQTILNYIALAMQILSMIMIGTKTAAIGVLLVIVAMFIVAMALHLLKLEKLELKKIALIFCVFVIAGYSLYSFSPTQQKYNAEKIVEEEEREEASESVPENINTLSAYLDKNAYFYYINPSFLESYPVDNDEEFWLEVVSRDRTLNIDNRVFKIEIIERIIERNNNSSDKYFGIGYTSNVPYTERDYIYQYFIFGIAGIVILILPYFLSLVFSGVKILMNYKSKLNLENCAIGMSICCYLIIAYFSGHVFGMMINMLFINLFTAKLLINAKRKGE